MALIFDNYDKISKDIFITLEECILQDSEYMRDFHNKVFEDEFKFKISKPEENKIVLNKIKANISKNAVFQSLVFGYLARLSLRGKLDENVLDNYLKMKAITRALTDHSSPFEILYYFSVIGVKERTQREYAKNLMPRVSWNDIRIMPFFQIQQLDKQLIYDWKEITKNNIDDSEIEKLFRESK